jgi:3-isopropylmalate dehydratase small subunit
MLIDGRVWVFGDHINTDLINPGRFMLSLIEEAAQHTFEAIVPDFAKLVRKGDVIVAGKNFGCGSSREMAPQVLKYLGIACILAEDFARIFFRNSIAIGLPAVSVKDISKKVSNMDEVSISLDSGEVILKKTGEVLKTFPLHPKMRDFINKGGIEGILRTLK